MKIQIVAEQTRLCPLGNAHQYRRVQATPRLNAVQKGVPVQLREPLRGCA